ncbi:MAG: sigma-54-dependent transcriptional regulator [Spirosomataceae bacterium]
MQQLLLIDDEVSFRRTVAQYIELEGFEVLQVDNLKNALATLTKKSFPVVLCDVKLPDGSGVDFVLKIKELSPETEVLLFTAYGNIPDGVQAIKNGAFDYLVKGDDNNKILPMLLRAFEKASLQFELKELRQKLNGGITFSTIIGSSRAIEDVKILAQKVAKTDTSVLLLGETGAGKEVFAQAIHTGSLRSNKPFIALNCSAFGHDLLESELFGHKAGAFTGAIKDKKGLIEEAHQGTLFLDEIGEMPLDLQAKLLRFLETGVFYKVGESKPTKVDVRIISATNRNLEKEAEEHRFRLDLFYRLASFQINIPSLNQRREDIPALVNYFLQFFAHKLNTKPKKVSDEFIEKLKNHHWKGNVRELRNVIERSLILSESDSLSIQDLPFEIQHSVNNLSNDSLLSMEYIEKTHIQKVLNITKGNKAEAARLLEIGIATLYRKIEEYKL